MSTPIHLKKQMATQGIKPSKALLHYLADPGDFHVETIKLVDPDTAVMLSTRGEYAGGGGTAKFSQVRVWRKGQLLLQEWQYKYSYGSDRWDLLVRDIGEVKLTESAEGTDVEVELIGGVDQRNRSVSFTFKKEKSPEHRELTGGELTAYGVFMKAEHDRVIAELRANWEKSSARMPTPHGSVKYRMPKLTTGAVDGRHGVSVFVAEEQIDHRSSFSGSAGEPDCQMQQKLYLVKHGEPAARVLTEVHSYEQREGSKTIWIIELKPTEVRVNAAGKEVTLLF